MTCILVGMLVIFSWIGIAFLDLDLHSDEEITTEGRRHILNTCYESALLGLNLIVAFVLVVSVFALQELTPLDSIKGGVVVAVACLVMVLYEDATSFTVYTS